MTYNYNFESLKHSNVVFTAKKKAKFIERLAAKKVSIKTSNMNELTHDYTIFMKTRGLPLCDQLVNHFNSENNGNNNYANEILYIESYTFCEENENYEFQSNLEFLIISYILNYKNINHIDQITPSDYKQENKTSIPRIDIN